MTRDEHIVEGNTRTAAARKAQFPTIHAVILKEPWGASSEDTKRRIKLLGAAFNTRHGKGIDRNEIRDAIEYVGANGGYDATRIAALLNVTAGTVENIFNEKRAKDRVKKLKIEMNDGAIGAGQLQILGANQKIHDEPFGSGTV